MAFAVRGLAQIRLAMVHMAQLELRSSDSREITRLVDSKLQFLVAAQVYGERQKRHYRAHIQQLIRRYPFVEVVFTYDVSADRSKLVVPRTQFFTRLKQPDCSSEQLASLATRNESTPIIQFALSDEVTRVLTAHPAPNPTRLSTSSTAESIVLHVSKLAQSADQISQLLAAARTNGMRSKFSAVASEGELEAICEGAISELLGVAIREYAAIIQCMEPYGRSHLADSIRIDARELQSVLRTFPEWNQFQVRPAACMHARSHFAHSPSFQQMDQSEFNRLQSKLAACRSSDITDVAIPPEEGKSEQPLTLESTSRRLQHIKSDFDSRQQRLVERRSIGSSIAMFLARRVSAADDTHCTMNLLYRTCIDCGAVRFALALIDAVSGTLTANSDSALDELQRWWTDVQSVLGFADFIAPGKDFTSTKQFAAWIESSLASKRAEYQLRLSKHSRDVQTARSAVLKPLQLSIACADVKTTHQSTNCTELDELISVCELLLTACSQSLHPPKRLSAVPTESNTSAAPPTPRSTDPVTPTKTAFTVHPDQKHPPTAQPSSPPAATLTAAGTARSRLHSEHEHTRTKKVVKKQTETTRTRRFRAGQLIEERTSEKSNEYELEETDHQRSVLQNQIRFQYDMKTPAAVNGGGAGGGAADHTSDLPSETETLHHQQLTTEIRRLTDRLLALTDSYFAARQRFLGTAVVGNAPSSVVHPPQTQTATNTHDQQEFQLKPAATPPSAAAAGTPPIAGWFLVPSFTCVDLI